MRICSQKFPGRSTVYRKRRAMREMFGDLVSRVPEGKSGNVEIKHVYPSADDVLVAWHQKQDLMTTDPYVQLDIDGMGWMHDILEERLKNQVIVHQARGDVLIGGLGIGMILAPILRKPEVRTVHVLENSEHVARLVLPTLDGLSGQEKLTVEMADAAVWSPPAGQSYDAIWLDCIAWWAREPIFVKVVNKWFKHYRAFLKDPGPRGSYLGHWAFDECVAAIQRPNPFTEVQVTHATDGEIEGYDCPFGGWDAPISTEYDSPFAPSPSNLLAAALASAPGGAE